MRQPAEPGYAAAPQENTETSAESYPASSSASVPAPQPLHNDFPRVEEASGAGTQRLVSTHISELRIRDFALVEDQRVQLTPGLNVVTGESGSGKSVLVEAFAAILGSPAPEDCVRPPATTAVLEGTVQLSAPAQVSLWTAFKLCSQSAIRP